MHEDPHAMIDPKGLRYEVGNVSILQSVQRNGLRACPDCTQTGMCAGGALMPAEAQPSGTEGRQSSAMGSHKTARTVRDEDEGGAKVRTPDASAGGHVSCA